jgi:uncharacterized membrane protein
MNAINTVIVQSPFLPVFLGSTLTAAALAVLAPFRWDEPGAALWLTGGVLYVVGMFVVTAVFNVPLNNALAAVQAGDERGRHAMGAVSRRLDVVESRPHGDVDAGLRAVHRGDCAR